MKRFLKGLVLLALVGVLCVPALVYAHTTETATSVNPVDVKIWTIGTRGDTTFYQVEVVHNKHIDSVIVH